MLRFYYVIIRNMFRAPLIMPPMRDMAKHKDRYTFEQRYAYAQKVINYMKDTGRIKTEVYGEENLPKEGGYVMFPNHQGKYDALGIIYAHKKPCTFVMDKRKSYTFLVREIVNLIEAKRIVIDDVRQGLTIINQMTTEVKKGRRYIIFSEGGYSNNHNKVQEFKPGSFKSAMRAQAPIVPVCLIDSYKVFYGPIFWKPVTTKVIFMKPLYYDEYKDMKSPEIAKLVRQRIIDTMKEYGVDGN